MKRRRAAILFIVVLLLSSRLVSWEANGTGDVYLADGDAMLSEYFTPEQIREIRNSVYIRVAEIVIITNMLRDGDGPMRMAVENVNLTTGNMELTREEAELFLFKKLGIKKNLFTKFGYTKAVFQFVVTGKDGERVVMYYRVNLGYNAFKEAPPYGGFLTLDYYMTVHGQSRKSKEVEMISYADMAELSIQERHDD